MHVSLIRVSIWTIWSIVLLFVLKPACRFESTLFVCVFLFFEDGMIVAYFHKVGILPEIQILLYMFRRYFCEMVGNSLRNV